MNDNMQPDEQQWYIYLLQNALAPEVKIGVSTDPARRMCSVQHVVDPDESFYCACPYALRLESEIKREFSAFRVSKRGGVDGGTEWFEQECKEKIMDRLSVVGTPLQQLRVAIEQGRRKVLSAAQEQAILRVRTKAIAERHAADERMDRTAARRCKAIRRGFLLLCEKKAIVKIESASLTTIITSSWNQGDEERFEHKLPLAMRVFRSTKLGYGVIVIRRAKSKTFADENDALTPGINSVPLVSQNTWAKWLEIKRLANEIQDEYHSEMG